MKPIAKALLSALFLFASASCFADLSHKVIVYEYVEDYWDQEFEQPGRRVSCNNVSLAHYTLNSDESENDLIARVIKSHNMTLPYIIVDDFNMPDVVFKPAWRISGGEIIVDLRKVKQMRMNQIRYARNSLLLESDLALLRALEREDKTELANIKAWRQALRDIPQKFDMSLYRTPEEVFNFAVPPEIPLEKLNQFVFSL